MPTRRSFPLYPPGSGTSGPPSQLHAYLLQLVDTLFHAADGGQRAERLGVQTPETVLPADLEECYNPTLLPTKQKKSHDLTVWSFPGLTQKQLTPFTQQGHFGVCGVAEYHTPKDATLAEGLL